MNASDLRQEARLPAVVGGDIRRDRLRYDNGAIYNSLTLNARRPFLSDMRVRKALWLAYDFEWVKRAVLGGDYGRLASYIPNMEFEASRLAGPRRTGVPRALSRYPAARAVHRGALAAGRRQPRADARQPARGARPVARSRIPGGRRKAGRSEDRAADPAHADRLFAAADQPGLAVHPQRRQARRRDRFPRGRRRADAPPVAPLRLRHALLPRGLRAAAHPGRGDGAALHLEGRGHAEPVQPRRASRSRRSTTRSRR